MVIDCDDRHDSGDSDSSEYEITPPGATSDDEELSHSGTSGEQTPDSDSASTILTIREGKV